MTPYHRGLGLLVGLAALLLAGAARGPASAAPPPAPQAAAPAPLMPSATPTPPCAPPFALVASPDPPGVYQSRYQALAARAAGDIWAVGTYDTLTGNNQPLIEHWDGAAWSVVDGPSPGLASELHGVAALAADNAWAVGQTILTGSSPRQTLIEHWNGTAWTVVPSPNRGSGDNQLTAIAALGPNNLWAVGDYYEGSADQPLILHWDGTAWTTVPSPWITPYGVFNAVTALAPDNIWAVGYAGNTPNPYQALVEHWDGTTWQVVSCPNPGAGSRAFWAVAAAGPNDVWAVGQYNSLSTSLIEHWDGATWSVVPCPNVGMLLGLAVRAPNDIWAASFGAFALHWDGATWTTVPTTPPGSDASFQAIAAAGPDLWTVGYYATQQGLYRTLIERRSGTCPTPSATPTPTQTATPVLPTPTATPTLAPCATGWSIAPRPDVGALSDVALLAPNNIWAVGEHILHWDGTAWNTVAAPPNDGLFAIAALAPDNIWAVGNQILHWDGTAWTLDPTTVNAQLHAITALAPNNIWAVGPGPGSNYALHWDGTTWTRLPLPGTGQLNAIQALATDNIWAVGGGFSQPSLVLHWDGTAWTVVPAPSPGPFYNELQALVALAPTNIWAAGSARDSNYTGYYALILHWDGTTWTRVPNTPATDDAWILSFAALAPDDIWATGEGTITLHWDGLDWTPVPSPPQGGERNSLQAVVALGHDDLWAVGLSINHWGDPMATLIERYTTCATPTPTATAPPTHTVTATGTHPPTQTPTHPPASTHTPSNTPTARPSDTPTLPPTTTPTICPLQFADVPVGSTFYTYVHCLACRGIVGGYPCGGPGEPCPNPYFRPGNPVTRGQTSKIVSAGATLPDRIPPTQQTFQDVPPGSPFWLWVEQLAGRGILGGYPCGGPGEPCVAPENRPYFRPNTAVTRSQLAKIVAGAAGYSETPTGQTFADVPPGSPFYLPVERLAARSIMSGYPCGSVGEPCAAPGNRPYFRPASGATRAQAAKIIANTFWPACPTPARAVARSRMSA